jgi:hypothetical protein
MKSKKGFRLNLFPTGLDETRIHNKQQSLSAPYLLSGRKDSFELNLPALGAPFALWGGEVSHGVLME